MHKFIFLFSYVVVFMISSFVNAQISLSFTREVNHGCNGNPCNYSGPSILINEVMLTPALGDGSMFDTDNTRRGEWIELYNPDECKSVDISCFYLGNNASDPDNYGGGYRIPNNTIIPPMGFAVIRGMNATPVPANLLLQNGGTTVELIADNLLNNICIENGGNRLWFPNAGGWFAFYNKNGIPQDAISWNNINNSCMSCSPCIPLYAACAIPPFLPSYDSIPLNLKNYITNQNPASFMGQSWKRIPDGGSWSGVASSPTIGNCNTNCNPPPILSCDGKATVTASGGTPPYTYLWDNPQSSTTPAVTGLCKGSHCVTVTDANNIQKTECIDIINYTPHITFIHPPVFFLSNSNPVDLTVFVAPKGGVFSGLAVINPLFYPFIAGIGTHTITYVYADTNTCTDSLTQEIKVLPSSRIIVPNFLTPNADHQNDEFIMTHEGIENFRCIIFNRWGRSIYEWNDISKGWDGKTMSGTMAAEAVYFYIIYARGYDSIQYEKHGSVTLLR